MALKNAETEKKVNAKIKALRDKVDAATREMLGAAKKRLHAAKLIGQIKAREKLPVKNLSREREVTAKAKAYARKIGGGVSGEFAEKLAKLCIKEACKLERRQMRR